MSQFKWFVPNSRNALFGLKYRCVEKVSADSAFAGEFFGDSKTFWTKAGAEHRACSLNRRDWWQRKLNKLFGPQQTRNWDDPI